MAAGVCAADLERDQQPLVEAGRIGLKEAEETLDAMGLNASVLLRVELEFLSQGILNFARMNQPSCASRLRQTADQ